MSSQISYLFGNNKPQFTIHFYQRYAERVFNVANKDAPSWAKHRINVIKIIKDFYNRFPKMNLINASDKSDYYKNMYGNDVIFLQHNKYIFVVREYKVVVTVYKLE
jgi:hypothetical protein